MPFPTIHQLLGGQSPDSAPCTVLLTLSPPHPPPMLSDGLVAPATSNAPAAMNARMMVLLPAGRPLRSAGKDRPAWYRRPGARTRYLAPCPLHGGAYPEPCNGTGPVANPLPESGAGQRAPGHAGH